MSTPAAPRPGAAPADPEPPDEPDEPERRDGAEPPDDGGWVPM